MRSDIRGIQAVSLRLPVIRLAGRAGARRAPLRRLAAVVGLLCLTLPARGVSLRPIVQAGDVVDGVTIAPDGSFDVGPLNDSGQLCFGAESESGERLLIQYADGKLTPIVAPGQAGPLGQWPENLWFDAPVSMNERGDVVFSGLLVQVADTDTGGTFLWDRASRTLAPVALPGMSLGLRQSLEWAAGPAPVINRRGEIALVVNVKNAAGWADPGLFFRDAESRVVPVALPDQALPDGSRIAFAFHPSLTDAGAIGFLARRQGTDRESLFIWEQGALRSLPVTDPAPPADMLFLGFDRIWLNNRDGSALLSGHLHSTGDHHLALYRIAEGRLTPVVLPGQEMPGGGRFLTVQDAGVSTANDRGQHAFLATLQDGATACYLLEPDGRLSLLLKSGAASELGTITHVGPGTVESHGIGLNNRGEVALTVAIADGGATVAHPDAVVLLTPRSTP